ncbi:MAG: transcriptional regulator [Desulfobacterales bacterium]|nr:transcriptional regulator [Desulfobacterales bacterium]
MKTIRQYLIEILEEQEMDPKGLSKRLKISEKEVHTHLTHIQRSLKAQKKKLHITPAQCLRCDFVFKDRNRFTRPGRCPKCKEGHLSPPCFKIKSV